MIVTHDPDAGLSYIYLAGLIENGGSKKQIWVEPDIILDIDANGALIGIELLRRDLLHPSLLERAISPGSEYGVEVCLKCDPVRSENIGPEVDGVCPECGAKLYGLIGQ